MTASPMNPLAGPSGPGKFAKRTDQLTFQSPDYGAGVENTAIRSGVPIAKTRGVADNVGGRPRTGIEATPLTAPTQNPNEPITAGIDTGAGPGSEALMMSQAPDDTNFKESIKAYLPVLSYISSLPNTSPETRKVIRQLVDEL